jgi:hypothetical protein
MDREVELRSWDWQLCEVRCSLRQKSVRRLGRMEELVCPLNLWKKGGPIYVWWQGMLAVRVIPRRQPV